MWPSPATRPAWRHCGCGPARPCGCGAWRATPSTRRTPASSWCRCAGATIRRPGWWTSSPNWCANRTERHRRDGRCVAVAPGCHLRMTGPPTVVAVGLGPAGPELLTAAAADAIARIPVRFLRTGRHPSASVVAGATTFDHVYESAASIDDVYPAIVEALVAAASTHG